MLQHLHVALSLFLSSLLFFPSPHPCIVLCSALHWSFLASGEVEAELLGFSCYQLTSAGLEDGGIYSPPWPYPDWKAVPWCGEMVRAVSTVGLGERWPISCPLGSQESDVVQPVLLERRGRPCTECPTQKRGELLGLKQPSAKPQGHLKESCADLTSLPAHRPLESPLP